MLYGSIRRNLYAHLSIHKMRWTLVFDYLFTPISTPKWHESIWFCMKFYEFTISKNFVTMRFYGLLLMYIDLWKKANLQRYLISFYDLPIRKALIYKAFRLSLDFLYALFTPFFVTGGVACWNWRIAFTSDSSVTWTYLSIVVLMLACPNSCCSTLGCTLRSLPFRFLPIYRTPFLSQKRVQRNYIL